MITFVLAIERSIPSHVEENYNFGYILEVSKTQDDYRFFW